MDAPQRSFVPQKKPWRQWTQDELDRLFAEGNRHATKLANGSTTLPAAVWEQIAGMFPGRTATACKYQYYIARCRAEGKAIKVHERKVNPQNARYEPPVRLVDLPEPETLTAAILGDPLPGRSALDKKRAMEAV